MLVTFLIAVTTQLNEGRFTLPLSLGALNGGEGTAAGAEDSWPDFINIQEAEEVDVSAQLTFSLLFSLGAQVLGCYYPYLG